MAAKRRATRWAGWAVLPACVATLAVLLICGAFAEPAQLRPRHAIAWGLLVLAGLIAGLRSLVFALRGRRDGKGAPRRWAVEAGLVCGLQALALTQITGGLGSPLYPLVYLLAAAYVLALPALFALPLVGSLLGLDAGLFLAAHALPAQLPLFAAHAVFTLLFAGLYHSILRARLFASRRAEREAVGRRIADAEERARELRLIATAEAGTSPDEGAPLDGLDPEQRHLLAGVAEVEEVLRGALAVAEAALRPHTVAVFLLAPDGESARLRECISKSDRLFRGPLPAREGALGAVLASGRPLRLAGEGPALSYYESAPEEAGAAVGSFCGVPLCERSTGSAEGAILGALIADRAQPFSSDEERVLCALAAEVVRSIEAERLLSAVRREKEEKARFFRALEALNKTTTVAQSAQVAVAQARRLCPAIDLCAVTLVEPGSGRPRHKIEALEGASGLAGLTFADNAGLVCNVVRLGAPLPGRDLGAMDKVVIFDNGTVVRGLRALKIFPLRVGESAVGTLVCGSRLTHALPESAQRELAMLALQAAESLVRTRLHEETERLATTDGLTGLCNRRALNEQLAARLREALRYKRQLSFLLLDVDHFKKVNDSYGHPAGDAVLQSIALLAQAEARDTDVVARYGGEEMALILPETDAAGARVIAERIRTACAKALHQTEQGALKVTLSIGVSTSPGDGKTPGQLIEAADRALYRAKQGGRNRVEAARGKAAA